MTTDYAANVAFFLLEKRGSVLGTWEGKLSANSQREIFGQVIGRGKIIVNGTTERICNRVRVCFGHDWDDRNVKTFAQLNA